MPGNDDDFLKSLQETFQVEAAELLEAIAAGLLRLEKALPPEEEKQAVEAVFRAAHSLKSSSAAVGAGGVAQRCAQIETMAREDSILPPNAAISFTPLEDTNDTLGLAIT